MRTLFIVLISAFIVLLPSCWPSGKTTGEFILLPKPQVAEFTGNSALLPDAITHYRLADGIKRPVPLEFVKQMEETNTIKKTQVVFRRDRLLDIDDEGDFLDITRENVTITGKRRAGLMYGFITLEQLMNDAREQGVPLPL